MRAQFIYEKFTQDSDPIHDMGIGIFVKRTFFSEKEMIDYLLKILPGILKTEKIPKDILYKHGQPFMNDVYFIKINDYLKKYCILEKYSNRKTHFSWESITYLCEKLKEMGFEEKI